MNEKIIYPLYRKYKDGRTWFKINSINGFEELKISGIYFSINSYKANILPDRNFINDLIYNIEGVPISKIEYEQQLDYCLKNLKQVDF